MKTKSRKQSISRKEQIRRTNFYIIIKWYLLPTLFVVVGAVLRYRNYVVAHLEFHTVDAIIWTLFIAAYIFCLVKGSRDLARVREYRDKELKSAK